MDHHDKAKAAAIEIYYSLNEAVGASGGMPLSPEDLYEMTAMELLTLLATNNIRFEFKEPV